MMIFHSFFSIIQLAIYIQEKIKLIYIYTYILEDKSHKFLKA